jgi:hypothetical protein
MDHMSSLCELHISTTLSTIHDSRQCCSRLQPYNIQLCLLHTLMHNAHTHYTLSTAGQGTRAECRPADKMPLTTMHKGASHVTQAIHTRRSWSKGVSGAQHSVLRNTGSLGGQLHQSYIPYGILR